MQRIHETTDQLSSTGYVQKSNLVTKDNAHQEQVAPNAQEPDEQLLQSIWIELEGKVGRDRIRLTITRANAKYAQARVKTFLPILIRRYVMEELKQNSLP